MIDRRRLFSSVRAMISGDAIASTEFWSITGSAGEGMLFTFGPDPRKKPSAAAVVAKSSGTSSSP